MAGPVDPLTVRREYTLARVNGLSLPQTVFAGTDSLGPFMFEVVSSQLTADSVFSNDSARVSLAFRQQTVLREHRGSATNETTTDASGYFSLSSGRDTVFLDYFDQSRDTGVVSMAGTLITFRGRRENNAPLVYEYTLIR